jgi:hypothetical protein
MSGGLGRDDDSSPRPEITTDSFQKLLESLYKNQYEDFVREIVAGRCPAPISQASGEESEKQKFVAFENALLDSDLFSGFVKSLKMATDSGEEVYVPEDQYVYQNTQSAHFQLVTKADNGAKFQKITIAMADQKIQFTCSPPQHLKIDSCTGNLGGIMTANPVMFFDLATQLHTTTNEIDAKFGAYFQQFGYEFEVVPPRVGGSSSAQTTLLFKKRGESAPSYYVTPLASTEAGSSTTQTLQCSNYMPTQMVFLELANQLAPELNSGNICQDKTYTPADNPSEYWAYHEFLSKKPVASGEAAGSNFQTEPQQILDTNFNDRTTYPNLQFKPLVQPSFDPDPTHFASWGVAAKRPSENQVAYYEFALSQADSRIDRECHQPIVYDVDESCGDGLDADILALLADPERLFPLAQAADDSAEIAFDEFWGTASSEFTEIRTTGLTTLTKNKIKLKRMSDGQVFILRREDPVDEGHQIVHELSCRLER